MWLKKDQGGSSMGDYTWEHDGDVVQVDDILGEQLLLIGHGGYTEVDPTETAKEVVEIVPPARKGRNVSE